MTSIPGVYMRAPETWPFKTPTIPSKLVPSHKTYAPNNEGLVFVDPRDIATLLGLGFYLYGPSPDINALLAGLPGAGDSSMFLAMDGIGRTPAGGGSSGLVLLPGYPLTVTAQAYLDTVVPAGYSSIEYFWKSVLFSTPDYFAATMSFDGGVTFLADTENQDSYFINSTKSDVGTDWPPISLSQYYLPSFNSNVIDTPTIPLSVRAILLPGSLTELAGFRELSSTYYSAVSAVQSAGGIVVENMTIFVSPKAVVTPTPARITTIRWQPYGSGVVNPVPSGNTFSGILTARGSTAS